MFGVALQLILSKFGFDGFSTICRRLVIALNSLNKILDIFKMESHSVVIISTHNM